VEVVLIVESKPIQKFAVAGLFAYAAKVFQGLDDACSKELSSSG